MTGHEKSRGTFNRSAVAHREEDISGVRAMLAEWRSRGVSDVRSHLDANPQELKRAIDSIRLVDVNDAALELYEARTREELLGSPDATRDAGDVAGFKDLIVAIADGRTKFEFESTTRTLGGKRLDLIARMLIPPEGDESATMLVAVLDITGRKRAEEAL